jgi:hypothetical protein
VAALISPEMGNFSLFSLLPDTLRRKSPGAQLNVSLISRGEKVEKAALRGSEFIFTHPAKRQSWREQSAGETLLSAPI